MAICKIQNLGYTPKTDKKELFSFEGKIESFFIILELTDFLVRWNGFSETRAVNFPNS